MARLMAWLAIQPMALWWLLALYGAMFAAYGVEAPFLPALMQEHGLRPETLGLVLSAGTGVRLISTLAVGWLADRLAAPRGALAVCLAASAAIGVLYLPAYGLLPLLLVAVAHAAAQSPLGSLSDALAVAASRPASAGGAGVGYGWVRGAGSAAFTLAAAAAGLFAGRLGLWVIVPLSAGLFAVAALAATRLPSTAAPAAPETDAALARRASTAAVADPTAAAAPAARAATAAVAAAATVQDAPGIPDASRRPGIAALFRLPGFPWLLLVAACIAGSHAFHESFAVIAWRNAGTPDSLSGLLWAEAVVAEVLVFFVLGPWVVARIGPAGACAIAAAAAVLRWSCMALTVDPLVMAFLQPLHGLTFALQHLACMGLLAGMVPPALAVTAQAAYHAGAIGLAKTVLVLACGPLYAAFGTGGFWAMALLAAAALPACLALGRRSHGPPLPPPTAASRTDALVADR